MKSLNQKPKTMTEALKILEDDVIIHLWFTSPVAAQLHSSFMLFLTALKLWSFIFLLPSSWLWTLLTSLLKHLLILFFFFPSQSQTFSHKLSFHKLQVWCDSSELIIVLFYFCFRWNRWKTWRVQSSCRAVVVWTLKRTQMPARWVACPVWWVARPVWWVACPASTQITEGVTVTSDWRWELSLICWSARLKRHPSCAKSWGLTVPSCEEPPLRADVEKKINKKDGTRFILGTCKTNYV